MSLGQTLILLTQRAKSQMKAQPRCCMCEDASTKLRQRSTPPIAQLKGSLLRTQSRLEGNGNALDTPLLTVLLAATRDKEKIRNRQLKL